MDIPTPEEVAEIRQAVVADDSDEWTIVHRDRARLISLIDARAGDAAGGARKHARTLQKFWGGYEVEAPAVDAARAWMRGLVNDLAAYAPEPEAQRTEG